MPNPVKIFQESQKNFIKSYYYVDEKICKRSACNVMGAIITDAESFMTDNKSIIFTNNNTLEEFDVDLLSAETLEDIVANFNISKIEFSGSFYSSVASIYISSAYIDSQYVPVAIIMCDKNVLTTNVTESGCTLFDTRFLCSFMAKELGYCQNKKTADMSNVISRLDTGGYQYPSYPIIGHNCKQCGVCISSCQFVHAIKNSITNTATKIQEIDAEANTLSELTRSVQQVKIGEDIVVE